MRVMPPMQQELIAAAGNSGNSDGTGDNVAYPAKYPSVIVVAASDIIDNRASFSSTRPAVELTTAEDLGLLNTHQGHGMVRADLAVEAVLDPTGTATIEGTVTDEQGEVVSTALVRIKGTHFETLTDGEGKFAFTGVPAGFQEITAVMLAEGYYSVTERVFVVADQIIIITFRLPAVPELMYVSRVWADAKRYGSDDSFIDVMTYIEVLPHKKRSSVTLQ